MLGIKFRVTVIDTEEVGLYPAAVKRFWVCRRGFRFSTVKVETGSVLF